MGEGKREGYSRPMLIASILVSTGSQPQYHTQQQSIYPQGTMLFPSLWLYPLQQRHFTLTSSPHRHSSHSTPYAPVFIGITRRVTPMQRSLPSRSLPSRSLPAGHSQQVTPNSKSIPPLKPALHKPFQPISPASPLNASQTDFIRLMRNYTP